MVFRTELTQLFGIRHPIIVGGMMWLSTGPFVAACARAGALAFMTPRSYEDLASFEADLHDARIVAGTAPIGVNITLSSHTSNADVADWVGIALGAGVRIFETAGRFPVDAVGRIHAGGGRVIHKCTTVRHALAAARAGADAIAFVGMEAGGHPGQNPHPAHVIATSARRQFSVPMAVGGAIGTGAQVLSALALGAGAAVIGTRLLTASEIWAHPSYKARLVETGIDGTGTALGRLGATWRVLDNATLRAVQEIEMRPNVTITDFGDLVRGRFGRDHAYSGGDPDKGMLSCSAAVGFAETVEPAERIIAGLVEEMEEAMSRLDQCWSES